MDLKTMSESFFAIMNYDQLLHKPMAVAHRGRLC